MCSIRDPNVSNVFARPKVTTNIFFIDFDIKSHLSLEIWINWSPMCRCKYIWKYACHCPGKHYDVIEWNQTKEEYVPPSWFNQFSLRYHLDILVFPPWAGCRQHHGFSPRFSPSSTSSSSKCPPRPRASRDQHPPCPSPFLLCSALDHIDKRPQ